MGTIEERAQLDRQIRELQNRLNARKIQKARYGYSVDPVIENEIGDLEFTIATLERQRDGPRLLEEAREGLERHMADNVAFVLTTVRELAERQTKTEEKVKRIDEAQYAASEWRQDKGPLIDTLVERAAREDKDAPRGRKRTLILLIAAVVLLVIILGSITWLAVKVH